MPIHGPSAIAPQVMALLDEYTKWRSLFSAEAVTEGSTVVDLAFPAVNIGGINYRAKEVWITRFEVTPTGGGTVVDVKLYADDAGSEVLTFFDDWDATGGNLVDRAGLLYRDTDADSQELHLTIEAITGGPGTYTIEVEGFPKRWE